MLKTMRNHIKSLISSRVFELSITLIILLNAALVGIELSTDNIVIKFIQLFILGIFTLELIARRIAVDNWKEFFEDWWNIFDLFIILISYIPETIFVNATAVMAVRVLRVFRALRLLRLTKEVKVMTTALLISIKALFYNAIMFVIFIYLFALVGVSLFKLPNPSSLNDEQLIQYQELMQEAPNAPTNSSDPYGSLDEAMFTLFRTLTGDDWTDLRYNLITAHERGIVQASPAVITLFHVLWFVWSSFLLLNLLVAAIVNNYQLAMDKTTHAKSN